MPDDSYVHHDTFKIHFNIILHLQLTPSSAVFRTGFPVTVLYAFLIFSGCAT
jgi:hypothetical protein